MGWLGDSSHRRQGCQAWTAVGLPPWYPQMPIQSSNIKHRSINNKHTHTLYLNLPFESCLTHDMLQMLFTYLLTYNSSSELVWLIIVSIKATKFGNNKKFDELQTFRGRDSGFFYFKCNTCHIQLRNFSPNVLSRSSYGNNSRNCSGCRWWLGFNAF